MLGCGGNKKELTPEEKKQFDDSKRIERQLKADNQALAFKLLLLGTGDSGKSTFTKQLTFIFGKASEDYIATFGPVLMDNALDGMQTLLSNMEEFGGIPSSVSALAAKIRSAHELTEETAANIVTVWNDKTFQNSIRKEHNLNIQGGISGAKYYFTNSPRFAAPGFVPTKEDALMARRKTVGIVESHFMVNNANFTLVDVGGQRSERKKWLHCFNNVTAVIFLTAINEYDMVLEEDTSTNRLLESLKLWKALTSSQFFKITPFVLFLNKSDLFAEKIKRVPLGDIFADFDQVCTTPEFKDLSSFDKSWKYILKQFRTHFEATTFYHHLTNVLDAELCQKVFGVVQDTVLKEALKSGNLI